MSYRFPNCSLAIIAGGRARRLGGLVKAHLRLPDGRTLLQRTLEVFNPLVDDVFVVSDDPRPFEGLRVVPDIVKGRGAPGGVHTACVLARTEWVLALAADLPNASPEVLASLWDAREENDVVVPRLDCVQPLQAFYRTQVCAAAFEPPIQSGDPSFSDLCDAVRTRVVDVPDRDRASFENVNTPEDLARAGLTWPTPDASGVAQHPVH